MVIQRTPSTTIRLLRLASHTKLIFALYITNFLVCTTLFMLLEHKSFGDSLWWCTVTWFTVGYGDLYPLSGYGRLFGMYVIISSHIFIVLLTANVVAKLSQYRAEAALEEERRMHKQEMKLLRDRLTKTAVFATIEHPKKRFDFSLRHKSDK